MVTGLLLLLGLVCFLATCQDARANHWNQNASLLSGTYLLIALDEQATSEILYMKEYALMQGIEPTMDIEYVMSGIVVRIDNKKHTTDNLLGYLNASPTTTPSHGPALFSKTEYGWRAIDLPCVWGDVIEFHI
jgi:hypothetical protein